MADALGDHQAARTEWKVMASGKPLILEPQERGSHSPGPWVRRAVLPGDELTRGNALPKSETGRNRAEQQDGEREKSEEVCRPKDGEAALEEFGAELVQPVPSDVLGEVVLRGPQEAISRHGEVQTTLGYEKSVESPEHSVIVLDVLEHVEQTHGIERPPVEGSVFECGASDLRQSATPGGLGAGTRLYEHRAHARAFESERYVTVPSTDIVNRASWWELPHCG